VQDYLDYLNKSGGSVASLRLMIVDIETLAALDKLLMFDKKPHDSSRAESFDFLRKVPTIIIYGEGQEDTFSFSSMIENDNWYTAAKNFNSVAPSRPADSPSPAGLTI